MLSAVSILALGYLSLDNRIVATASDLVLRNRLGQVVCDRVSVDLSSHLRGHRGQHRSSSIARDLNRDRARSKSLARHANIAPSPSTSYRTPSPRTKFSVATSPFSCLVMHRE